MLHKLLRYDSDADKLFWRERPLGLFKDKKYCSMWNSANSGAETFKNNVNGYLCGTIFGMKHRTHRVIWAMHYGEWPKGQIDHINRDKTDNRVCNLRDVSQTENQRNRPKNKNNTSGHNGIYTMSNKRDGDFWAAHIQVDGENIHLGNFAELHNAVRARKDANIKYGFSTTHGE